MTRRSTARRATASKYAAAAGELDVPVPFELGEFCDRLAHRRGRPICLVPRDMARTGANGFLCRTAREACAAAGPAWLRPDLDSETAWLVKVARALTALPPAAQVSAVAQK